jgi:phosphatidylserine/phosphatidylglycerophosphate/cardiolipin synthase-like enzyme
LKRTVAIACLLLAGLGIGWAVVRMAITRLEAPEEIEAPALMQFGPYHPGMDLRQAFESLPPAGGEQTGLSLIHSNLDAWAARWRMLTEARQSIDFTNFILREDVYGAAFLGHLLHKAQQGLRIRLLLDSQGTVMSFRSPRGNDWLDTLANTGNIELKLFRPIGSRYLEALATLNPQAAVASEHDKILVCDRRLGMIGGRNISTEYFAHPADKPDAFEDTDLILYGRSAARGLVTAFELQFRSKWAQANPAELVDLTSYAEELLLAYRAMDAWLRGRAPDAETAGRIGALQLSWIDDLAKLPRSRGTWAALPAPEAHAETRLLDSQTRLSAGADIIAQALLRLVQGARERILIQSPYLVLSEEAVDVLAAAARRGVAITVYTNSPVSSDNAMSQAFFLEQWPRLLARVPGLRLFVTGDRRTLHSKLMVFDDRLALVGTYNLDPVSMGLNSEIMAAVWSAPFARRVGDLPRKVLARGAPTVYEYKIKRNARGAPLLDKQGNPIVVFGPRDHAPPDQWRRVQTYWTLLRAAEQLPGFSPVF